MTTSENSVTRNGDLSPSWRFFETLLATKNAFIASFDRRAGLDERVVAR